MHTNTVTIVAPSSREALRLVREQLGPDAIILSNRATATGTEIVAMVDAADGNAEQPAPSAQASAAAESPAITAADMSSSAPVPQFATATAPVTEPVTEPVPVASMPDHSTQAPVAARMSAVKDSHESVISEIHSMRGMIEEQLAGLVWNDKQRRDPVRGHLLRTLLGAGFSASLAKAMLDHLPTGMNFASGLAWVKAELARNLPLLENEDAMMDSGGVYALMGPTGVGKTTTTAKLAARCVMRFGADKLALLTTDSYRIGAFEQLRIYGRILGVSVHAVKDAADLRLALDDLRDKHMVLIDTVGKSQRDRSVSEQVAMLCGAGRPVKRLLLLNAASHGDTLNEVVHAYKDSAAGNELAGCIFTKTDEATHPGALLDTVIRHRLPVHYVSTGQKVPENLLLADRLQLVDSVFQSASRSALFVPGEADLGELPAALNNDAELAAAAAQVASQAEVAERLRAQCKKLIRVLAHDAEELAINAAALAGGDIGFDAARELWRDLGDERIDSKAVGQKLLMQARAATAGSCVSHILAVSGKADLLASRSGDAYSLQTSLLLSDVDGEPLAAPHQLLSTAGAVEHAGNHIATPALRQIEWLQQQNFDRPLVHLLERPPQMPQMLMWQGHHLSWLARGRGSLRVMDGADGSTTLARLAAQLEFGAPKTIIYKGKTAHQSATETIVRLRIKGNDGAVGTTPALRCVVTRIVDPHNGKQLAQWYLLSNVTGAVSADQLAAWACWKQAVDPFYRFLRQAVQQLGGCTEPGDADMLKRLSVAGQASTTIWRLAHKRAEWAGAARTLLAQLAGHRIRSAAVTAASAAALFEGFGKLIALLQALELDADAVHCAAEVPGLAVLPG
ncbi:flagellar biosynthesis protein FlhF [Collimonas arenae]|uniref:Flagellar biosynthesis protein FlhF n=1 Tax=Collimonas arenae TaxID=279058 RepID=A0A127QFD0_9BURK|nr:flagellar biosynthesis protein FlhF [Collimonas arenae]AMO98817.1 flagellar biosynthesis protein FlhF [Collimonas arenae]AMP08714.1 flagellar biosynthesis protein FlhF [Collimonas arenae]